MSQTPDVYAQPSLPANLGDFNFSSTGLEEFAATDAVLPRLKILQKEALWTDNLSGVKRERLRFIPLGLVKQRVLFHHNVEDNDVPMCKSSDFNIGFPNPEAPKNKSFPWGVGDSKSGFNPADFPPDEQGQVKLPCASCKLKEWDSSPLGSTPYCAEQWTIPVYYDTSLDDSGEWAPAILTLQKSSLKPIKTYLTSFASSGKPPFLAIATGTLRAYQRGQVDYAIPTFIMEGESPRDRWQEFHDQFMEMRTFLQRPPVREEVENTGAQQNDNSWNQQPAQAPAQQAPAQQQDPWTGQPVQQAPQQSVPPAQGQPDPWANQPQQPVQQTPPPAPAPPAPPVQQTPPPAPQPVQQPVQEQAPAQPQEQQPEPQAPPAQPQGRGLPF